MRGAVTASTLTSIAVFLPMVFVEGIAGQVFGDLGITVVVSLLASLLVAVYFIPMLASRQALESQTRFEPVEKAPHRWVARHAFLQDYHKCTPSWRWVWLPYGALRLLLGWVLEGLAKGLQDSELDLRCMGSRFVAFDEDAGWGSDVPPGGLDSSPHCGASAEVSTAAPYGTGSTHHGFHYRLLVPFAHRMAISQLIASCCLRCIRAR